ncbi:MAG: cation:proton antiporter, partial [Bdellovibrionales bacterium]
MIHLPKLIEDLAFILMTAAVTTLVFRALKQPVVLGYLLAGILVSPHVPLLPTITDTENLKVWAEIGVIFLLFGLGLEFSFRKLAQVGVSASITGGFEIIFMMAVGYAAGTILGWPKMDSLFLGGMLAISSTTIIVRAIDELKMKSRGFVSLVFGVLIVEDLIAILLLVLLSTMALTNSFSGQELLFSTLKFVFFITLWFVVGIYFLPLLIKKSSRYLNEETRLIGSIGLCLFMVLVATKVGFSPALGAFVMGSLLAETREGHSVEKLLEPVKNLFAAIFFVSVGMLIDPKVIIQNWGVILLLTFVTIFGKLISTSVGALISGQSLRHSLQAGMSLAQIGEFSFIIATLGLSLKVISPILYPIVVAISVITTFTTPYQIRYADNLIDWVENKISPNWKSRLEGYRQLVTGARQKNLLQHLLRAHLPSILLNTVIVLAITFSYKRWVHPHVLEKLGEHEWVYLLSTVGLVMFCIPFLWALTMGGSSTVNEKDLQLSSRSVITWIQGGISFFRLFWGVFLMGFILAEFVSMQTGSLFILLGLTGLLVLFGRYSEPFYQRLESRFLKNLTDSSLRSKKIEVSKLAPWDANLVQLKISADSEFVGQSLLRIAIRERFGVVVAMIERGHKVIMAPGRDVILMPQDILFLIGTDEQIENLKPLIEKVDESPNIVESYG